MSGTNGKLLPHQITYLRARGVSDGTIAKHKLFNEHDPKELRKILNAKRLTHDFGDTLCAPCLLPDGTETDYIFIRPQHPRTIRKPSGKVRVCKFENPHGRPIRSYLTLEAHAAFADPNKPAVFLTEGFPKALAASESGFPCISIAGVCNGHKKRSKKNGKGHGPFELNETLAALDWKGRRVYLVFDSDLTTNQNVRVAEWKLAETLTARGADVRVVRLPSEPNGEKNGLDDFLVRRGVEAFRLLVETAQPPTEPTNKKEEKKRAPSAADVLAGIGMATDLWHDSTGMAYSTIGRHSHPVRSKPFRQWLVNEYRLSSGGKVPNGEMVGNALNVVEAAAVFDNPEHPAFVRIGQHGDKVYLHLADTDGTVIEIGAGGWRVCDKPPVRFRKPAGMLPLPMPTRGGSLGELRGLLNLAEDNDFALVKAWLTSAFRPDGPFPLLVLMGEQGSAKTTTGRVLKRLVDPCAAMDRGTPRDERDAIIRCRGNWLLPYDNLSHLPDWLSDVFCRLATGGGFGTRELYSNDDEVIFDSKRPLILNGISEFVERSDLLERSLLIRHPSISEEARRPESEFWNAFASAHPGILGAVLDRVAAGLRELPGTKLERLPRMADFALFAVACERGVGEPELFQAAYADNQASAQAQALDISSVTAHLVEMMGSQKRWEGSASELLKQLTDRLPRTKADVPQYPQDWPKKPDTLTKLLSRLAPDLRRVHGLSIETGRQPGGKRTRFIRITNTEPESKRESASHASHASRTDTQSENSQADTTRDAPGTPEGRDASQTGESVSRVPGARPGGVPEKTCETQAKTPSRDARDARDACAPLLSGSDDVEEF